MSAGRRVGLEGSDERRAGLAGGDDVRALSPDTAAGPRRDGRGLRGRAHGQRMDRRRQADVGELQQRPGVPRADEARSPHHRPSAGTPCGAHPRLRRNRWANVLGDAPHRGRRPGRRAQAVRSADPGSCGSHHHPGRRGAGRRACRRCDAPRHQTAEHLGHPRRLRLPGRLRDRQRHHRREDHPTGHRGGHLEIHGARTLLQRRGHLPRRHLRAGVRAARVPDRHSAIQVRQRHHAGHLPPDGAGPAAQRGAPGRPASV